MTHVALVVCLLASLAVPPESGGGQAPWPSLAARLAGEWSGRGSVAGRTSDVTMSWSRDVGGAFLHLRFRNAMAEGAGRPAETFEARGYYRFTSETAGVGTWVDSRGVIFPLAIAIEPDALVVDWGAEKTERGRTRYRLADAGTLEAIDLVRLPDGQYREFGRVTLTRTPR